MRMLQRKLAGQGVNITIGNAIAREAGVNKKCEINLSSKLEEVDFAFFNDAMRQMAFPNIGSYPVLLQTTLRMRGKGCLGSIRKWNVFVTLASTKSTRQIILGRAEFNS